MRKFVLYRYPLAVCCLSLAPFSPSLSRTVYGGAGQISLSSELHAGHDRSSSRCWFVCVVLSGHQTRCLFPQIVDCDRRKQELQRTAQEARCTYTALCDKYGLPSPTRLNNDGKRHTSNTDNASRMEGGVEGTIFSHACSEEELRERILSFVNSKLPEKLADAESLLKEHGQGMVELYRSFQVYQSIPKEERGTDGPFLSEGEASRKKEGGRDGVGEKEEEQKMFSSPSSPLHIFHIVAARGNIPACDLSATVPATSASSSSSSSASGRDGGVAAQDGKKEETSILSSDGQSLDQIDFSAFGIEIEAEGEDEQSSGDSSASSSAEGRREGGEEEQEEEEGNKKKMTTGAAELETGGSTSSLQKKDKETLLESRVYRRQLLDDIFELHAFLNQRLLEGGGGGASSTSNSKGRGKSAQGGRGGGGQVELGRILLI